LERGRVFERGLRPLSLRTPASGGEEGKLHQDITVWEKYRR
jgi:hypothetical protein